MTTFLLIRHAEHDWLSKGLAGRVPGVHLNIRGQAQAERLARRLAPLPLRTIYSSPLERACQTAAPLATQCGLELQIAPELNELDFGAWSGATFRALEDDPAWEVWNRQRSSARAPRGETMAEAAHRMALFMAGLEARHPGEHVALVSHCDVIRAVLLHLLGLSFDDFGKIEISPGSVSVLTMEDGRVQVRLLNETAEDSGIPGFRDSGT